MKRPFLYLLSFFLLAAFFLKIYDKIVEGFYPYRIQSIQNASFHFQSPLTEEVQTALTQPYSYLASGSQSFAFVSKDGKYVLKFFKNYRWKKPWFFSFFPLRENYKEKIVRMREEGFLSTCKSCLYSYQDLQKETGLIYLQIEGYSPHLPEIVVKNRLFQTYRLPLKNLSFALQYKAQGIKETLMQYKQKNDLEGAKKLFDDLFAFILKRKEKGLTDKDPNFLNNFGIYENVIMELDIGGFIKDPIKDMDYFFKKELFKAKKATLPWLKQHYPELASYVEERFLQICSSRNKNLL